MVQLTIRIGRNKFVSITNKFAWIFKRMLRCQDCLVLHKVQTFKHYNAKCFTCEWCDDIQVPTIWDKVFNRCKGVKSITI